MRIKALNKTQLAILIGCYSESKSKIKHKSWADQWDNSSELLSQLRLTRESFKKIKLFTREQTLILIDHFKITQDELQEVTNY